MKVKVNNPLPRITPEEAGIKSGHVLAFVNSFEERGLRLHSYTLQRAGRVFAEGYYAPYTPMQLQTVYSHSKSFTSLAIGMAADDGVISLEDGVLSFFPEYEHGANDFLHLVTVRHLLTMSTGQFDEPPLFFPDGIKSSVESFFKTPVQEPPGKTFRYNTHATYMLSAILRRKGIDLEDFLQQRLFDKLGITGLRWRRSSEGICTGGYGLSLVPEAQALFGRLLAQKGVWNGERIISEGYLDLATILQIENGDHDIRNDWAQGYGFQFWCCTNNCFRADGMYGQVCVVSRDRDIVYTATSYCGDIQAILNVFYEFILPNLNDAPIPPDAVGHNGLMHRNKGLRVMTGKLTPPSADILALLDGRSYVRTSGLPVFVPKSLQFIRDTSGLAMRQGGGSLPLTAAEGYNIVKRSRLLPDTALAVRSGMNGEGKLIIELNYLELLQFYEYEIDPSAPEVLTVYDIQPGGRNRLGEMKAI